MQADPTTDPRLRSWVPVPQGSDFPIQNLPFGVFLPGGGQPRVGVGIGEWVLDLAVLEEGGLLPSGLPQATFATASLNPFMALGRSAWREVRERLSGLLREGSEQPLTRAALVPCEEVELLLPIEVADYVDFYSSLEHATNMGKMLRPDSEPLLPNWRYLPVGYHGRSGTVVVSDTPVLRPRGQVKPQGQPPEFRPTRMLDVELEVGFIVGVGNALGRPIPPDQATEHVFGMVLVNDWSARDIQSWEYVPLGPFLGKSFATSISAWVVTLDALRPYRVPPRVQEPPPLDYLDGGEDWAYDIHLELALGSESMGEVDVVSRTSSRNIYWTIAQQLAHLTANGARVRPGDLCASGTVSGSDPGSFGSLMELTWRGDQPLPLSDGSQRTFLEDGDTAVLRGWCENDEVRIGFGEVRGQVVGARL